MATSTAFTLSILLLVAVCVIQCTGTLDDFKTKKYQEAWSILTETGAKLGPIEVLKLLQILNTNRYLRDKDLGHGLLVRKAYHFGEDRSCDLSAMLEFNKFYVQADLFNESIKNFLIYYYEKQIENCEEMAYRGLSLFQKKKPALWRQLEEFFNAIKSDDKLYADLGKGGSGMNEEMINLLGDVLRKKKPGVVADHQRMATYEIRNICEDFRKTLSHSDQLLDSLLVVKKLSSGIKRQGDLPEHARYLHLCKRAEETVLPREAQRIKLLTEYQDELKKLQNEYQTRIEKLGQEYRAQIDDLT